MNAGDAVNLQLELAEQEQRIRDGIRAFWQIGDALNVIRQQRLYSEHYATFELYCRTVWNFTARHARHLMSAAEIYEFMVATWSAENGTTVPPALPTHEAQLRPLAGQALEQAAQAWGNALAEHGAPTSAQVKDARDRILIDASPYFHIQQDVQDGVLRTSQALALVTALDSCRPDVRVQMVRYDVQDTTLIREMNRIASNHSETYAIIIQSGYIQFDDGTGVKLQDASAAQLRQMLDEARSAHITTNSKNRTIELYPDDPLKSLERLISYFGYTFIGQMIAAYSEYVDHAVG